MFETDLNYELRAVYIFWQIFLYVFCIVTSLPCLYVGLKAERVDTSYLLFSCFGASMPVSVLNVTCAMIYCRDRIKSALQSVDSDFDTNWNRTEVNGRSEFKGNDDNIRRKIPVRRLIHGAAVRRDRCSGTLRSVSIRYRRVNGCRKYRS